MGKRLNKIKLKQQKRKEKEASETKTPSLKTNNNKMTTKTNKQTTKIPQQQQQKWRQNWPDAERTLNGEPHQAAGILGEHVADLLPVDGLQQVRVRRVLHPFPQVQQASHQALQLWQAD